MVRIQIIETIFKGEIQARGTPSDLAKLQNDFAQMIKSNDESVENSDSNDQQTEIRKRLISTASSNSSAQSEIGATTETVQKFEEDRGVQMEDSSKGKAKGSVSLNYYLAGANWFALAILVILLITVQMLASGADYWVSVW